MTKTCDVEGLGREGMDVVGSFQVLMPAAEAVPASPFRDISEWLSPSVLKVSVSIIIIKSLKVVWPCVSLSGLFSIRGWRAARYAPAPPVLLFRGSWVQPGRSPGHGPFEKSWAGSVPRGAMTPGGFSTCWVQGIILVGSREFRRPLTHPACSGSPGRH